ncbi:MAG: isoprenyl transferase [Bacteroidales bacterium]|jgi:undecaprenyl diphosphate synthase|nr:isoprenyl transferase [Bacteroidales bacterium]
MTEKAEISEKELPKHIAIIMDGNGRWAKEKGKKRIFGHKNGVKAVREVVEGAAEIGIKYLTLYAFSTENWNRPQHEIDALMTLLVSSINSETGTLNDNNVRLLSIGNIDGLPKSVKKKLLEVINATSSNTGLNLVLALNYSAKWEIINAVKNILAEKKEIYPQEIDEVLFEKYLSTKNIPDPDLLIRTSGEFRVSNFLLWQIAYTELYFTDIFWPDFRKSNLYDAISDFQSRERRFGRISEQKDN